tara:strand:+ start:861 stop:1163 length:303 start_codon:yes stop_codon:yes gene_type:complete
MNVNTPLLLERRNTIANYLLEHGKHRAVWLAAKLEIPESVVSGLLKYWERQGHFHRELDRCWVVTGLGLVPTEVPLPMDRWWHYCDAWQPGDQVVETIDD